MEGEGVEEEQASDEMLKRTEHPTRISDLTVKASPSAIPAASAGNVVRQPPPSAKAGSGTPALPPFESDKIASAASLQRGPHHRRAHSELAFRIPEDLDLASSDTHSSGFEEIGTNEDPFCTYMDMEKIECKLGAGGSKMDGGNANSPECRATSKENRPKRTSEETKHDSVAGTVTLHDAPVSRPQHRYSNSVDGSMMFSSTMNQTGCRIGEIGETKKAMPAEKLEELAAIDPKRAKRIVANRQSAARSKERKARYISELEQKVQALQTEATTLSAQLALYQRDTFNLTSENAELKIRCQAMEQQAQLSDALSKALKQEVERLQIATGDSHGLIGEAYNAELHHVSYSASLLSSSHRHPDFYSGNQPHSLQIHQFPAMSSGLSDLFWQQSPLGAFHGLDINGSACLVKSESPSISATESSTTF